jgi:hypothetical protein
MKKILSLKSFTIGFLTAVISVFIFYIAAEYSAKKILIKSGIIPNNGIINANTYGRVLNLYTVSENSPNYIFSAYDDNFHKSTVTTDSNGFIIGDDTPPALSKEKAPGTIRIFLIGGSAAFGSIQTRSFIADSSYPEGTYTYNASICGKLKNILTAKYPGIKFEVVNAAVVLHQFHQGYAMYLEKIHDFHPDIVINFDFQNDMAVFNDLSLQGDPYYTADQMNEQLNLEVLKRCPRYPYLSLWWNIKHLEGYNKLQTNETPNGASHDTMHLRFDNSTKNYKIIEPYLIQNLQKMLWLINSYETQLETDNVYSVFCIQPLLLRNEAQKQLSPLEVKLRSVIEKTHTMYIVTVADSVAFQPSVESFLKKLPGSLANIVKKMDNNKFKIQEYAALVFNDYLSPKVDSIVRLHNGTFIDMGKQMTGLTVEQEFYVDYCHMTPFGNQFVAEQMANAIDTYLQKRKSSIQKEKLP